MILPILVAAFAAYAFTFMKFPGRDLLFVVVVGMLVVPSFVSFVPVLRLFRDLGMGGTFPAVWLFHVGFGMSLAIFMIRNYMATLPLTVIESAKIDGASHFQTFFRLVLPMSVPVLASFAIFQFLWVWNDLLVALVFLGPGENAPMTVSISQLLGQQGQNQELVTASGMFSMLIPIIVFLSLQRFFVRGLTAGAVKADKAMSGPSRSPARTTCASLPSLPENVVHALPVQSPVQLPSADPRARCSRRQAATHPVDGGGLLRNG